MAPSNKLRGDRLSNNTFPPLQAEQALESAGTSFTAGAMTRMAKKLMTCFSHLGGANHAHALGELEACGRAMVVEQLGSRGCSKTLRTPGGGGQRSLQRLGARLNG